jgi:hypothetical protein
LVEKSGLFRYHLFRSPNTTSIVDLFSGPFVNPIKSERDFRGTSQDKYLVQVTIYLSYFNHHSTPEARGDGLSFAEVSRDTSAEIIAQH